MYDTLCRWGILASLHVLCSLHAPKKKKKKPCHLVCFCASQGICTSLNYIWFCILYCMYMYILKIFFLVILPKTVIDDGFLGGVLLYVVYIHVLNHLLDWPRCWTGGPRPIYSSEWELGPLLARWVIATWGRLFTRLGQLCEKNAKSNKAQFPMTKIYSIAITLAVTVELLDSLLVGTYMAIVSRIEGGSEKKSLHRKGSWRKQFTHWPIVIEKWKTKIYCTENWSKTTLNLKPKCSRPPSLNTRRFV